MATNYPNSLDSLTNPTTTDPVNNPSHAVQHVNANDAIEALQSKVGINNSAVATSLDYRVRQLELNPVTSTANKIEQVVVNNTGSTLLKGQVVYASGSVGASGKLRVSLSSNAAESTSSKTFGILAENIIDGGEGLLVTEGLLENIDTTGANDGDPVWLGTNGAKIYGLANKPSAPAHLVFVGIVVRGGNANNGSIFVKVQNGFELDELHTVSLSSLADKDLLTYDSATGLWKNKTFTTLDIATKTYVDSSVNNLSNTVTTDYVPIADVGQPDGVASLDSTGKIPLAQMGNLVDGAPTALDTLNELAAALGDNPNYATDITTALGTKVSKNGGDTITSSLPSVVGLKIKGATSQTVNLQEWQNDTGTVLASIWSSGTFATSGRVAIGNGSTGAKLDVMPASSTQTGVTIKSNASQTADLQQWQQSDGTVTSYVGGDGNIFVQNNRALFVNSGYIGSASLVTKAAGPTWSGLIVKGAASQTANLQEWQNSAGSLLGFMNAYGTFTANNRMYAGWAAFGSGFGTLASASNVVLIAKGSVSQTADLQQWQDSGGNVLAGITQTGNGRFSYLSGQSGVLQSLTGLLASTNLTNRVNLTVQAIASQTADLQQWQNSAGTVLAKIDKDGNFISSYATSSILAGGGRAIIDAYGAIYTLDTLTVGSTSDRFAPGAVSIIHRSGNTTHVTVGIKGMASQTGDLTQWQNSSGTVLAKITSTGAFDATAITINGQPVSGGAQYQTTAPSSPTVGQIWIDSDDDIEAFDLTNKKTEIPASISANTNLVAGRRYFVTSASALTLTLPASPALNDEIQVIDASGNASTYNITIARNGNLINGTAGNLIIDNNGGWYSLVYTGNTYGWKVG